MKRIILLFILTIAFQLSSWAQYLTSFEITDINNDVLTAKVQDNLGKLVSEINTACAEKRTPKLKGIDLSDRVSESIMMMWESSPFRCEETEVIEPAFTDVSGWWQIRNIPFIFTDFEKDDQYHECIVSFDNNGKITGFHMAISQNLYRKVMKSGAAVKDARRRQLILDYVEQFRTAYCTKDMPFLQQVYSEDALIITGHVVKVKPSRENNFISSTTKYSVQDKKTYLKKLAQVFRNNRTIRVTFDEIKVQMHPTEADWYAVTLHQGYTADRYHDDGWLFLLWDFTDEDNPTIHVRSWQADTDPETQLKISEDEIFGMDDVNIVK